MKYSSLTPRSVDAAGLALCAGVLAAFYFLAAGPLVSQGLDARAAAQSVKDDADRVNQLTASMRQLRQSTIAATEKLARYGASAQRPDSINDRISSLVGLAKSLGLQLAETTPAAPRQGKEFDAVPVRLGGQGTLASLVSFLDALHAKQTDVAVESLDLRAGTAGSRENNAPIEFSLLLTSYVEHAAPANPAANDAHDAHDARDANNTLDAGAGAPAPIPPETP